MQVKEVGILTITIILLVFEVVRGLIIKEEVQVEMCNVTFVTKLDMLPLDVMLSRISFLVDMVIILVEEMEVVHLLPFGQNENSIDIAWVLDIDATHHVTDDVGNLTNIFDYTGSDGILVSNGVKFLFLTLVLLLFQQ